MPQMIKPLNVKKIAQPYKVRYNTIKCYKNWLIGQAYKGIWKQSEKGGGGYIHCKKPRKRDARQ